MERDMSVHHSHGKKLVFMASIIFILGMCLKQTRALAEPVTDSSSFANKQITFVVGAAAGGGYDEYVRLIAPFLSSHLPGRPGIVIQNYPGASGLSAAAYVHSVAPKDGLTLAMIPSIVLLTEALSPEKVPFNSGDFGWIGNITPTTHILAVDSAAAVKNIYDAKNTSVTIGATVSTGADYVEGVLTNAVLGTRFKIIRGYNTGTQEMSLAMLRGEIHGFIGSWDSWKTSRSALSKGGDLVYLLQFGPKVADLPNTPSISELVKDPRYQSVTSLSELIETMGRSIFTTPHTPQSRLDALRAAFNATMDDPAFLEIMKTHGLDVHPLGGVALQARVEQSLSSKSDAADTLREILKAAD
jgi:tripartite-type tricarboxylate transporter receptor subunit TctC